MKQKRLLCYFLAQCLVLLLLSVPRSYAAYSNGYSGNMAGEGNGIYAQGLDLSEWQGREVDFNKIREQGYSFVILRAGFASTVDACFELNYSRAKAAGLHIGVYLYSYADNTQEALNEAKAMKSWLSGKTLDYPVYYDLEDPKCHGDMSREELTEIAYTFLDELASEGWLVGVYSCKSWLENKIDTARIGQTYECWMAQFVSSGTYDIYDRYDEVYGMWQYSCTGTVDGVPGGVDMNVCFKDYPGICRQYGFNGHVASDESLNLSGAGIPAVIRQGEDIPVSGRVTSSKGDLTTVTAGIYSLSGEMLTGRSAGPRKSSFDLADLASGIRARQLPEGSYIYRVTAGNSYETRILLNLPLIIAKDGICAVDTVLPEDLDQSKPYFLSGQILSADKMESLTLRIYDQKGGTELELRVPCGQKEYDLALFQVDLASLSIGGYRLVVETVTKQGKFYPVDGTFSVWAANDPITLEKFTLQSEYFPGELTGLQGTVSSAKSNLRQIDIEILDAQGIGVCKATAELHQRQIDLSQYNRRLGLERLGIGAYRIRISALNDGGPQLLLDRRLLIRQDGLSLCGFEMETSIYVGDSGFLRGVVCSDVTSLTYVGVSVTDGENRVVLSTGAVPRGILFDLSRLTDDLPFSALQLGTYTLRVTAENESVGCILYDGKFQIVDHHDEIRWQENCMDPRGLSFSPYSGFALNGSLRSAVSPIEQVVTELSDSSGKILTRAVLLPGAHTAELERANEMLRFSALPQGEYRLTIWAENATGTFEMLSAPFSVGSCAHGSIRSGTVIQPDCSQAGAVTDSRCTECGEKVRSGFLIAALGHSEENGCCIRCRKVGFITVNAELCAEFPVAYERYVIAASSGNKWYALSSDGKAVGIAAPDANDMIQVSAGLLWAFEKRGDLYYMRSPDGKLLHLDSEQITVSCGNSNAELKMISTETGLQIRHGSDESRGICFSEGNFFSGEECVSLIVFRYTP